MVESRRIFRKLKAYVIYRFAATIQIVIVLTILIYVANCPINSLFIILLALFNDLSMLPVAYDRQQASAAPEHPDVGKILLLSATLGLMQTAFSLLWAFVSYQTGIFKSDFDIYECSTAAQSGVWVQMFLAAEFLIFSARTPSFMHRAIAPSPALSISVLMFCLLVSIIACASSFFGHLYVQDVVIIWVYDLICLFVLDVVKVVYLHLAEEDTRVLADKAETESGGPSHEEKTVSVPEVYKQVPGGEPKDIEAPPALTFPDSSKASPQRKDIIIERMSIDAGSRTNSNANIRLDPSTAAASPHSHENIITLRKGSSTALIYAKKQDSDTKALSVPALTNSGTIIVSSNYAASGSSVDLRRKISGASLRPHTPGNVKLR